MSKQRSLLLLEIPQYQKEIGNQMMTKAVSTQKEQGEILCFLESILLENSKTKENGGTVMISCNVISNKFMCDRLDIPLSQKNEHMKAFIDNKAICKIVFQNVLKATQFGTSEGVFAVTLYDERNHNIILEFRRI
jgi:hypothetical protein